MESISSGELDRRILLRRVFTVRDERAGSEIKTSEDVIYVWAKVEPISNRKIRTTDQGAVVETQLFTLRPRTDVGVDWQVVFDGKVYTVRATDRTKRDRLLITAEADTRHDRV